MKFWAIAIILFTGCDGPGGWSTVQEPPKPPHLRRVATEYSYAFGSSYDLVEMHDDEHHVTCYVLNAHAISCLRDEPEKETK